MSYKKGTCRQQLTLPCSLDEYVSQDNFVRVIDAFVDKVIPSSFTGLSRVGCSSYSPNDMIKLLIYVYFISVSSSRKIEDETNRNTEVIWLIRNLRPDHCTIAAFRRENPKMIKRTILEFRRFLKDSGYVKGTSVSTDGFKVKANASRSTISMTQIEKKLAQSEKDIERYLSELEENDAIESQNEELFARAQELERKLAYSQKQIEELEAQKQLLETLGRESLAPADMQAKLMKTKDGFMPAYNAQLTVDNESHFILGCEITDYPNDYHSLEENVAILKEQLEIVPEIILADGGYANEEQVKSLEKQGIECIVPFPDETESKKVQRDNGIRFTYDQEADCFKCSQGKTLLLAKRNKKKKSRLYNIYQCKECVKCPVKQHCTISKVGREISLRIDGEWLQAHKEKQKSEEFQQKFSLRKCVVEHPIGTMRYYMGQIPILLRGKEKVQIEMDLYSNAYNLRRLKNMDSVPVLLEKLAKWEPKTVFLPFLRFFCLFVLEKQRAKNNFGELNNLTAQAA